MTGRLRTPQIELPDPITSQMITLAKPGETLGRSVLEQKQFYISKTKWLKLYGEWRPAYGYRNCRYKTSEIHLVQLLLNAMELPENKAIL